MRTQATPSRPMAGPTAETPPDERRVREFLARYRPPGPPGARWTEAHVVRLLARMRAGR